MLEPQDRTLLTDALRPPVGFELDRAIGTTFTLDLLALLTTPLTFALFDWGDDAGEESSGPVELLEAARRYADRIHVFCQAGQIKVPKPEQMLFEQIEGSVFECRAPGGGIFHPKIWLLRFTSRFDDEVRYRFLCLSRNLTFDRSWDTALLLDGFVKNQERGIATNKPLSDFVAALPGCAIRAVPDETRAAVASIAEEVRRVEWDLPDHFTELKFWPLGVHGHNKSPFTGTIDRMMVISPFLGAGTLGRLTKSGRGHVLVSRLESLDGCSPEDLGGFSQLWSFSEDADLDALVGGDIDAVSEVLRGLHAKLFFGEAGGDVRIWSGSANATAAAFSTNVEFLAELVGPKWRFGINKVLGEEAHSATLRDLLNDYEPSDPTETDEDQESARRGLEQARVVLAHALLDLHVVPTGETFTLELRSGEPLPLPATVEVRAWPIRRKEDSSSALLGLDQAGTLASWTAELGTITSFVAFDVRSLVGERTAEDRFVLNLPLIGAPEDRRERAMLQLLSDPERLMRFLLFLLADGDAQSASELLTDAPVRGTSTSHRTFGYGLPLFEALLRALDRNPEKLDHIHRLVADLSKVDGQDLLPQGFAQIWGPVWAARGELRP